MGCYGGRWGQITKVVGLRWTGLVSPFSPISPPFFLGSFRPCTPPPPPCCQSKPCFLAFSAPNSPFFHRASKISHTFLHFPTFFLNQPISAKCTVTFRKRVFLRPAQGGGGLRRGGGGRRVTPLLILFGFKHNTWGRRLSAVDPPQTSGDCPTAPVHHHNRRRSPPQPPNTRRAAFTEGKEGGGLPYGKPRVPEHSEDRQVTRPGGCAGVRELQTAGPAARGWGLTRTLRPRP